MSAAKKQAVGVRELGPGGVQQYLKDRVAEEGGLALHFTSPGTKGAPDLIIIWPEYSFSRVHFVETKTIGGEVKPWQERFHKLLRRFFCKVFVIWTKEEAERYVERYQSLTA